MRIKPLNCSFAALAAGLLACSETPANPDANPETTATATTTGNEVENTHGKLFTPSEFALEPVPERTVGADNYAPLGSTVYGANEFHMPGKDCMRCHAAGKKAASVPFTMAGTVYKDILGSEPLAGAEVVLLDSTGKVISITSNAAGNFMTQTEIADADPDPEEEDRRYKAWVIGPDNTVLPMVTLSRMSCNMHHNPTSRRGALWAGSRPAAPNAAAAGLVSFSKHVLPIFAAKCAPCHIPIDGVLDEPLRGIDPKTGEDFFYDYTAGFDLHRYESLLKVDPSTGAITSKKAPVSGRKFLILNDDPKTERDERQDSLLLVEMLGPETAHAGGSLAVDENDPDYRTILRWIQGGAKNDL